MRYGTVTIVYTDNDSKTVRDASVHCRPDSNMIIVKSEEEEVIVSVANMFSVICEEKEVKK